MGGEGESPVRTPGTPAASPGLIVRPATPADAEAVTRLCDELNEHEGEPVGHFTPELVRRDGFGRTPPEFRILLALLDGEPAGYAMFHPSYSSEWGQRGVYLQDLFVRPAARRRGAGRALLAAVTRAAEADGRTFVWWCSKAWNANVQAFYAGLGAIEEDVRAHALFGEPFAALAATAQAPQSAPAEGGG